MKNSKSYVEKRSAVRAAKEQGLDPAALDFVQRAGRWTWVPKIHPEDDVPEVAANGVEDADEAPEEAMAAEAAVGSPTGDEEIDPDYAEKAARADAIGRGETVPAASATDPEAEAAAIAAQRASDAAAFDGEPAADVEAPAEPEAKAAAPAPAPAEGFPADNGMPEYIAKVRSGEAEIEREAKRAKLKAEAKAKKAGAVAKSAGETRVDGLKAGSKLALLADTVCRPEGATHAELCEAVGWATCLPMTMKACATAEITLRKEKQGRETRYWGTPKDR